MKILRFSPRIFPSLLDDGKVYYSDAEEGNKPESETDDIIDNAAKRILDVYRDAFTELAKGTDI